MLFVLLAFPSWAVDASSIENTIGLGELRSALAQYYGDHEELAPQYYPRHPQELIPKYLKEIPELSLPEHPASRAIQLYGDEVCKVDAEGLGDAIPARGRDTGKWGYVSDKKSQCFGAAFIDCKHEASREAKRSRAPRSGKPLGKPQDETDLILRETTTKSRLGLLRTHIAMYLGNKLRYPQDLGILADARYLGQQSLPYAETYPHHEPSNAVIYVKSKASLTDAGGWAYVNNPADPEFGHLFINCSHADSSGQKWNEW